MVLYIIPRTPTAIGITPIHLLAADPVLAVAMMMASITAITVFIVNYYNHFDYKKGL